jgi:hypothetical protein
MNLYDYVTWRSDLTFEYDPINELDVAILTMINYINWSGIVGTTNDPHRYIALHQAASLFEEKRQSLGKDYQPASSYDKNVLTLLSMVAHTPRFRSFRLAYFEEKIDYENSQQFAALTYFLMDHHVVNQSPRFIVTYRGTDNKWVGWKEDFQTFYMDKIPAQDSAEAYLNTILSKEAGPFIMAGHSKGGHLAVYAASKISNLDQARLSKIYSFDGLGFNFNILDKNDFLPLEAKTINFLPEDTIVGKFFPLVGKAIIVDSEGKTFDQHNPFQWSVLPKKFQLGTLSEFSKMNEKIIQSWVGEMDLEERRILLDGLFELLGAAEGTLKPDATKDTLGLWKELKQKKTDLDPETQEVLEEKFDSLKRIVSKYIGRALKSKLPWVRKKKRTVKTVK